MTKAEIVEDAIRRFPSFPNRTIARYILQTYGEAFGGDLENIRLWVRRRVGAQAGNNCKNIIKKSKVKMPPTWRKKIPEYPLKPGLWLILADIHIPFHEPKPIEAALAYGEAHKVDGILFNGDIQDCASASFWPSSIKRNFDREIELFLDFLDYIDKYFKNCMKVYLPGNHEGRLPRYYQSKAPELIGIPAHAMDVVLGFEQRKIKFLEYNQVVKAGKLPIIHGHEVPKLSRAVNPARGLFLRTKSFSLCSHCHTPSEHTAKNIAGTYLTTWSTGCLCDLNPDYNPLGNDWAWGFATVEVEKNGGFYVNNFRVLPNGKVV